LASLLQSTELLPQTFNHTLLGLDSVLLVTSIAFWKNTQAILYASRFHCKA
jgi:hypothetical protein